MKIWLALVAWTAATGRSAAAEPWEGVYEGALGQQRVIVELAGDGARYNYIGRQNDLGLIVTAKGGSLSLTETVATGIGADDIKANPKLVSGRWNLKQDGEKLGGAWTSGSGAGKLAVSLIRISSLTTSGDPGQKPFGHGAYNARWLATAPRFLPQGGEASIGPLSYTLVRDDLYGNSLPRLTRAPAGVRLEGINRLLQSLHLNLVLADRACMQDLRSQTALNNFAGLKPIDESRQNAAKPISQLEVKVVFATQALMAITETRSSFCGGAHPGNSIAAFTFDLANPRQIGGLPSQDGTLDDFGSSAFGSALDIAEAQKRSRFDALWIARLRAAIQVQAARPRGKGGDETDSACATAIEGELAEKGGGVEKIAYPLPEGLAIRLTGFPHAIFACALDYVPNPAVVPWREMQPFFKPAQKIFPSG